MKIIIAFLLLLPVCIYSQNVEYFDENWQPTTKENASYYREISFDVYGKPKGEVKDFYSDGTLQWKGKLVSVIPQIMDGECTWYYKTGQAFINSIYENGVPNKSAEVYDLMGNRINCKYTPERTKELADSLGKVYGIEISTEYISTYVIYNKANELYSQQDFIGAVSLFDLYSDICLRYGDGYTWLYTQTNIAYRLIDLGRFEEAYEIFNMQKSFYEQLKISAYVGFVQRGIGMFHYQWDQNFEKAIKPLEESRAIFEELNIPLELLNSEYQICRSHVFLGRFEQPGLLDLFNKCIERASKLNMVYLKADLLSMLGDIYFHRNEFELALNAYNESIQLYLNSNLESWAINVILAKSRLLKAQNQSSEARVLLDHALKIAEKYKIRVAKANVLKTIGEWYQHNWDFGNAIKAFNEALGEYRNLQDEMMVANTLQSIGQMYFANRKFENAIEYFEQANEIYKKLNRKLYGNTHYLIGLSYFQMGEIDKCEEAYMKSLDILRHEDPKTDLAGLLKTIGVFKLYQGKVAQGNEYLSESKAIFREAGRADLIAQLRLEVAKVYLSQGKADKTIDEYLAIIKDLDHPETYYQKAFLHFELANLYSFQLGNRAQAHLQYEESAALYRKLNKIYEAALMDWYSAQLYFSAGEYQLAKRIIEAIIPVFIENKQEISLAGLYNVLGLIYWYTDESNEDAIAYLEKSRSIYENTNNAEGSYFKSTLKGLGDVYEAEFNIDEADAVLQQLLMHQNEEDFESNRAQNLMNIGLMYIAQGNDLEGVRLLLEAREIFAKFENHDNVAYINLRLCSAYLQAGNVPEGTKYLQASSVNFDSLHSVDARAGILCYSSILNAVAGENEKAMTLMEQALQIAIDENHVQWQFVLKGFLSLVYSISNKLDKAQQIWKDKGDGIKVEDTSTPDFVSALFGHDGFLYLGKGDYEKAYEEFYRVIQHHRQDYSNIKGEKSIALMLNVLSPVNEMALSCLSNLNRADEAFTIAEDSKASILNRLFRERNFKEIPLPKDLKVEEQKLLKALQGVDNNLQQPGLDSVAYERLQQEKKVLLAKNTALKGRIRAEAPAYSALVYPEPITYNQIREVLHADEVVIAYFLGAYNFYAFVATPDTLIFQTLTSPDSIRDCIQKFRQEFVKNTTSALIRNDKLALKRAGGVFFETSSALYNSLVKPFEQFFDTEKKLIIIPHAELYYIPFDLLVKDTTSKDFHEYNYLVKQAKITYCPALSILHYERTNQSPVNRPEKSILAIGDPIFGKNQQQSFMVDSLGFYVMRGAGNSNGLSQLKYAEEELNAIEKLFEDGNYYKKNLATEDMVKMLDTKGQLKDYRYLHFSTHGMVNENLPELSCIALNLDENEKEDGLLYMYEIFQLRLNADLVVLSACETGLGSLNKTEGMIGFSRSLMYAGTPSLILSLWPVDDRSTANLFSDYYVGLKKNNGIDKHLPLRDAQLSMIKQKGQYANPYFWAPFVLFGERYSRF